MVPQRCTAARSAESKAAPRDGRQEGGWVRVTAVQSKKQASAVPEKATQGAENQGRNWSWVEAAVWNERMLAALGNGVKGGQGFSLIGIDGFVRRRLRAILRKQEKRPGMGGGVLMTI